MSARLLGVVEATFPPDQRPLFPWSQGQREELIREQFVELNRISAPDKNFLPLLTDFRYNSKIVVTMSNVLDVLDLSSYPFDEDDLEGVFGRSTKSYVKIMLHAMKTFALQFLRDYLHPQNVIITFDVAYRFKPQKVMEKSSNRAMLLEKPEQLLQDCSDIIVQNLSSLQSHLNTLTLDKFSIILAAKPDFYAFDQEKFVSIMKWVKYDKPQRVACCIDLLRHVSLSMVSTDSLALYAYDDFLQKYDEIVEEISAILSERLSDPNYGKGETAPPSCKRKRADDPVVVAHDCVTVNIDNINSMFLTGSRLTATHTSSGNRHWTLTVERSKGNAIDGALKEYMELSVSCQVDLSVFGSRNRKQMSLDFDSSVIYCKPLSAKLHVPFRSKLMNPVPRKKRSAKVESGTIWEVSQKFTTFKFADWDFVTNPENGFLDKNGSLKIQLEVYNKYPDSSSLRYDWIEMRKEDTILKVPLEKHCAEYDEVLRTYQLENCRGIKTVVSIERIQNPRLYREFQAEKERVTSAGLTNKLLPVSRYLFHGSDQKACESICEEGFDRSRARRSLYGRGIYFAITTAYSDAFTYGTRTYPDPGQQISPAEPDCQHMILAEVITGDYCQGSSNLLYTDLHNSATNNVQNPGIFVVFKTASAYPLYLLKYKTYDLARDDF